jgi:chemotaxis protein MotB
MEKMPRKLSHFLIFLFVFALIPSFMVYAGGSRALKAQLAECKEKVGILEEENTRLKKLSDDLADQIAALNAEKSRLERRIAELEALISQKDEELRTLPEEAPEPMIVSKTVEEKIQAQEAEIIELKMEKDDLLREKDRLMREKDSLTREKETLIIERDRLLRDKSDLETNIRQNEREISRLKSENRTLQTENARMKTQIGELEEALTAYEEIERKSQDLMDIAFIRIQELLRDEIRAGKVRVYQGTLGIILDVQGEYTFDMGSVEINPGGKAILKKVAILLSELEGYFIGIMGNADNKPIITSKLKKQFPTNWELSAYRGATVARFLIENGNLNPSRIVTMGLGEYQPIDDNLTEEGRGNNRRVDIVLMPIDVMAAVVLGAEVK